MRRKRQQLSLFEVIAQAIALIPWWLGVMVATATYYLLHQYTQIVPNVQDSARPVTDLVMTSVVGTLASIGQYVLPGVMLVGALLSALARATRHNLFQRAQKDPQKDVFQTMTWAEFELLVGEAYRRKGYAVQELGGKGPDGGVDLILRRDGDTTLVQCKHWKALRVGVPVVREVYGVMVAARADRAIVVTSGSFTREAKAFASGKPIELMAHESLLTLIRNVRGAGGDIPRPTSSPDASQTCPACGSPLVQRSSTRGPNKGRRFLGCSRFPACRTIIHLTPSEEGSWSRGT